MEHVAAGIASIFWASVWADEAERVGYPIAGEEITLIMCPTPQAAYSEAWRLLGKIEQLNGMHIACLVHKAIEADRAAGISAPKGISPDGADVELDRYAFRFGQCLAWEHTGAGVSWGDDHAECGVKVPNGDTPDLEAEARRALKARMRSYRELQKRRGH